MDYSDSSGEVQQADVTPNSSQIVLAERGAIVAQPPETSQIISLPRSQHRKLLLIGILSVGAIALFIAGLNRWRYIQSYEETDKAYVARDTFAVDARVAGKVNNVVAKENQIVTKGLVLVQLNRKDYEKKLEQAKTTLAVTGEQVKIATVNLRKAQTQVATSSKSPKVSGINDAAVVQARSNIGKVQAQLRKIEPNFVKVDLDYQRLAKLHAKGVVSLKTLENTKTKYDRLLLQHHALTEKLRQRQAALVQAQHNVVDSQTKLAQQNANSIQVQLSLIEAKIAQAQQTIASVQAQVDSLNTKVKQAQQAIASAKTQQKTSDSTQVPQQANLVAYPQPQQNLKQDLQQQQKDLATFQAERQKLANDIKKHQKDVITFQAQQKTLIARRTEQENKIAQLAKTKNLIAINIQAENDQYEQEVGKLRLKATQKTNQQAQAQVKHSQYQLYYTKITAPSNGRVNIKRVQVGEKIKPGQTLMSVEKEQPWIAASFTQEQLQRIKPGQQVKIRLANLSDKPLQGRVQTINPNSKANGTPPNPSVKISLDPKTLKNQKIRIIPGTPASVKVQMY